MNLELNVKIVLMICCSVVKEELLLSSGTRAFTEKSLANMGVLLVCSESALSVICRSLICRSLICRSLEWWRWNKGNSLGLQFHKVTEPHKLQKNGITDACSTADCCPLLTICPRCCPRHAPDDVIIHCGYHRLPLDGAVIGTFEYCSVCSDWTTVQWFPVRNLTTEIDLAPPDT